MDFGLRENSLPFFHQYSQRIAGEKLDLFRVIKTMNYSDPVSNFEEHWMNQNNNWTQRQFLFFLILQMLVVKIVLRYPASHQGPKYSNHWPYTVAYTTDCVCSKMLNHGWNHGLNHRLFLSLFKLIPCPIHWIVYVLAYFKAM